MMTNNAQDSSLLILIPTLQFRYSQLTN